MVPDPTDNVFRLREDLSRQALQESLCHRLQQLRALAVVMEDKDFHVHPPAVVQAYSWVMVDVIDQVRELFYELWDRAG